MGTILSSFLNPILPIFAVALVGFFFGRRGVFKSEAAYALNRFVLLVALPSLLFSFLLKAPFEDFDWFAISGYFASNAILYALGFLIFLKVFKLALKEALLLAMACCFTNHVFFILHIVAPLYGEDAAHLVLSLIAGDAFVTFGSTMVLLDILSQDKPSVSMMAKKLASNPMLVSLMLGLLLGIFKVELHPGMVTYVEFVGAAAAPIALFALGLVVSQVPLIVRDVPALTVTGFKLFLHPLFVYLFLEIFVKDKVFIPGHEAYTLFFAAAGPIGAMPFALALQYKINHSRVLRSIIYSNIVSLITLSIIS